MEEKIVFPGGDETAQKLSEKALTDEDVSEVSGGTAPKGSQWRCCDRWWFVEESCGICGKKL